MFDASELLTHHPDGTRADGPGGTHPLQVATEWLTAALEASADLDPAFLSTEDKSAYLQALDRLTEQLAARRATALAAAADLADHHAARSAASWLAHRNRTRPGRLAAAEKLGARLAQAYPATGLAWARGEITGDHATAIVAALDELPQNIPGHRTPEQRAELLARAEKQLLTDCADFTPPEIRRLGRRILELVAPEAAEEIERRLLDNEERRARARTQLHITHGPAEGMKRLRADLPVHIADLLAKAIDAYTNPRRTPPDTGTGTGTDAGTDDTRSGAGPRLGQGNVFGERLTPAQARGHGLCALIEHLPVDGLPHHGGTPIGLIATITLDQLQTDLGAATLDTGQRLSASATRRLACEHGILPAVLNTASEVLDLGRRARLHTPAQRRAHTTAHPHCQTDGCSVPAAWCEAHHPQPWTTGGPTNTTNLAFLCPYHHHRAHDPTYTTRWTDAGTVTFHRRP